MVIEGGVSKKELDALILSVGEERANAILLKSFPDKSYKEVVDELKPELKDIYNRIIIVLKRYCDLKEEYYSLIALWIIGTYYHKQFQTFPYLFFNAMKGSGKTRLLRLILAMCKDGRLVNSLSEAVLFRTASMRTFGIDEFENVGSKEKQALRELLNSAYKQGTCVERAVKVKTLAEEKYRIDSFDLYCPIVMANIWGMAEVLSDRCISLVIDKSNKIGITKLLEAYEQDLDIKFVKSVSLVPECRFFGEIGILWNNFVYKRHIYTSNIGNISDTSDTNYEFFDKIDKTGLDSRHLELFFPLFMIAKQCGEEILNDTLTLAKEITKAKKDDDVMENRDVSLLEFIVTSEHSIRNQSEAGFILEASLLGMFRQFMSFDEKNEEHKWMSNSWFGRALKRLNLIIEKIRHHQGKKVNIDINKAKEKIQMFKTEEKINEEKCA